MDNELSLPLLKQADNSLRYNQQSLISKNTIGGHQQQETQKKMMHLLSQ